MQNKTKKKLSLSYKTTYKNYYNKSRPIPLLDLLLSSSLLYIPSKFRPFFKRFLAFRIIPRYGGI